MNVIRWGIIGCGDVTEVKSGPGFYKCRGSELVAVMRRDGAKAADYAKRHGVRKWYDDADRLIGDPEVDAVYIATPPGTHEFYAMKVLAARKACYVEKPMARNGAEAKRMVEGFEKAGVPLFVAYYRRALPRFLKVKEILESGVLGPITRAAWVYKDGRGAEMRVPMPWRFNAEQSGGGLFLDMASHALDLFDFWLRPLAVTKSTARNKGEQYRVEDCVEIFFATGSGVKGVVDCRFDAGDEDLMLLTGDGGEVTVPCFANGPVKLWLQGKAQQVIEVPHPPHVGMPMIQTVVDDLLGIGKCASKGESGLRTQLVMDAALEKYYGGREDGFWLREWPGNDDGGRAA